MGWSLCALCWGAPLALGGSGTRSAGRMDDSRTQWGVASVLASTLAIGLSRVKLPSLQQHVKGGVW